MFRKLSGLAVLGLFLCAADADAADVKGKVVKVNDAKSTITLKSDGKETEYAVDKKCKFPKLGKKGEEREITLKDFDKLLKKADKNSTDVNVTAVVEKRDGADVVVEIKYDRKVGKKAEK